MISSISKTDQLKEIIMRDIRRGRYKSGDTLPSIQMLCRKYGVSKHTVSQALSNLSELGLIDTAPGKLTRISSRVSTKRVDVLYVGQGPIEQQEFWSEIFQGIKAGFKDCPDIECNVHPLLFDRDNPLPHADVASTSGYLMLGVCSYEWLDYLERFGVPAIMVYDHLEGNNISHVSVDYSETMQRLVDMFVGRGCKRIAYINRFPVDDKPNVNKEKVKQFRKALNKHGLPAGEELIRNSCSTLDDVYNATIDLLESSEPPDGIFADSDIIAQGIYRALYDKKLSIPDDIAVAACDNLQIGEYMTPSLTTIELARYDVGKRAALALAEKMREPAKLGEITQEYITPEIIVRESLPLFNK